MAELGESEAQVAELERVIGGLEADLALIQKTDTFREFAYLTGDDIKQLGGSGSQCGFAVI